MHHIILLFTARAWVPVSLSVNAGQKARVGLSASEPLSTPSVQHIYAVGPRSPFGLYAVCLARPGPAHFGSSANPPGLFCRFRIVCRAVSASPPLVAPCTPYCHAGDPGAQLWRVVYRATSFAPGLIHISNNAGRCERDLTHGHQCLSPPVRDKRHVRASLPRRPSPRHLCALSTPWGPGAPSACMSHVWQGRVPLASEARLIRPSAFVDSALSVAPSPLSTVRRFLYAALPRQGPRGPICGASYKNRSSLAFRSL